MLLFSKSLFVSPAQIRRRLCDAGSGRRRGRRRRLRLHPQPQGGRRYARVNLTSSAPTPRQGASVAMTALTASVFTFPLAKATRRESALRREQILMTGTEQGTQLDQHFVVCSLRR